MSQNTNLSIAYTPDSDDAFYYFALETGRTRLPGFLPDFHRGTIAELNQAARLGVHHITAISSIVYPAVADRYAILSVGSSVGRGYGPVLVSRSPCTLAELRGRRVGVGGIPTTGWFLLRRLCPEAVAVEMPFDQIAAAVARGHIDAGVMIHEELVYYPQLGLLPVVDLGAAWCTQQGLPLPVGLNVIRRDLGRPAMERICSGLRRSLLYALAHTPEALEVVRPTGRGAAGQCTERFVALFANEDSLDLSADVRAALPVLFRQAVELGLAARVPTVDVIEPIRSDSPSLLGSAGG